MEKITARDLYIRGRTLLRESDYGEPEIDARVILIHCLNVAPEYYHAHSGEIIPDNETANIYMEMINQRIRRVPVAYITGRKEFMGLEFEVNPSTLIPRPETETLVESALRILNENIPADPNIADIGTGSGNIAISTAHYYPTARITATDISIPALKTAGRNLERISLQTNDPELKERVSFISGSLFEPFSDIHRQNFYMILSNPPYVGEDEFENLMDGVRLYEPRSALCPPCPPAEFYESLIEGALTYLQPGGYFLAETGYRQAEMVTEIMKQAGMRETGFTRDLLGYGRVVRGRKL